MVQCRIRQLHACPCEGTPPQILHCFSEPFPYRVTLSTFDPHLINSTCQTFCCLSSERTWLASCGKQDAGLEEPCCGLIRLDPSVAGVSLAWPLTLLCSCPLRNNYNNGSRRKTGRCWWGGLEQKHPPRGLLLSLCSLETAASCVRQGHGQCGPALLPQQQACKVAVLRSPIRTLAVKRRGKKVPSTGLTKGKPTKHGNTE